MLQSGNPSNQDPPRASPGWPEFFRVFERLRRRDYAVRMTPLLVLAVPVVVILVDVLWSPAPMPNRLDATWRVMLSVFGAAFLILGSAFSVRRLHDRDRPGWWLLLFFALPALLMLLARSSSGAGRTVLLVAAATLALWAFVELFFLPGAAGANRFGPSPRERPRRR